MQILQIGAAQAREVGRLARNGPLGAGSRAPDAASPYAWCTPGNLHKMGLRPFEGHCRFMARYSPDHKARTREKIVKTACRCFREQGIKGVSIADLMEAMDLTHGGFYSHFASKDALVAETIKRLLEQSQRYLENLVQRPLGQAPSRWSLLTIICRPSIAITQ